MSQDNNVAGIQRVPREEDVGPYPYKDRVEEIPVEKLNVLRETVMSNIINQLEGELNPGPAYSSELGYSRFCKDCLDVVTAAIMDGLKTEEEVDVIPPDNARLVAETFLKKINFRVNDHVSLEFFNREGMKKCLDSDLFGGLPYEVARVVDRYCYDGKHAICEKLLGQHAYAATRSTGIVYDDNNQDPITLLSDHSGLTIGEVLSSAIGDKRCSCMQSESYKDTENEDVSELANLAKNAEYNVTPYNGYDSVIFSRSDKDGPVFFLDSEEEESDKEEPADSDDFEDAEELTESDGSVKHRIVNDDFRPSRSFKAESERGDAPPLCLSICRHYNCPFNAENKQKIFNAIDFVKQEEEEDDDGEMVALIDGQRHKIKLRNFPSFAIGSSVYEVLVYDHDPLTAVSVSSSNKNAPDDIKYDHAMRVLKVFDTISEWENEEGANKMADMGSALCDQIFAKPCAKAYLTVTTAAVPWPCILKAPPMSDVNSEGKYGSFRSFVVPLPCSYGGRRLNDSTNGWRSKIYSNFVEDFVRRSVKAIPKGRLIDPSKRAWNFSTLNITHHILKTFGSVLRSECGDLDLSPLEYKTSTSLCSRDIIEAQSHISKLRRLLDTFNKDLDTFTDGPYREATVEMRNIASEIEQELEKKTEETAARKLLLDTLNGQFEKQHRRVVLMTELATKQDNFRVQLQRQLNNLSYMFDKFVINK